MNGDVRKAFHHHDGLAEKHVGQDSRVEEERLVNLTAYASNVA
jgi:hypothetical protein